MVTRCLDSLADASKDESSSIQRRLLCGALGLMDSFDAHAVCQQACRLLDDVCDAQAALITMKDDEDYLIVAARYNHLPVDSLEGVVVPEGSVTEAVLDRGTTVILTDEDVRDRESKSWLRRGHTFLGVPVGDAASGIIGSLVVVFSDSAELIDLLVETCELVAFGFFRAYSNSLLYGKSFSRGQLYERERLALLLHDDLAQTLFSSSLKAERLREIAEAAASDGTVASGELAEGLGELATLMSTMQGQLRSVLGQMRQEYGSARKTLEDVVAQRVTEHRAAGGAEVSWKVASDTEVSDYVTALVDTIVQEGLANVRKHSKARSVHLWVRPAGDMLHVVLDNDGVIPDSCSEDIEGGGFGLGLENLRRLVQGAGGTIRFCSNAVAVGEGADEGARRALVEPYESDGLGSGFTVTARLPLDADRNVSQCDDLKSLARMQTERYGRRAPVISNYRQW